jgi:methyl-accepting chemotaxis protein/rhodanese-related sulfurtransferase
MKDNDLHLKRHLEDEMVFTFAIGITLGMGAQWLISRHFRKKYKAQLDGINARVVDGVSKLERDTQSLDTCSKNSSKWSEQLTQQGQSLVAVSQWLLSHQAETKSAIEKVFVHNEEGEELFNKLATSMQNLSEQLGNLNTENEALRKINDLNLASAKQLSSAIEQIIEKAVIIKDIAFQTKILAFNASVEAARAGEHGKGFAVVASEMANLANVSGRASLDIQSITQTLTNELLPESRSNQQQLQLSLAKQTELLSQTVENAQNSSQTAHQYHTLLIKNTEQLRRLYDTLPAQETEIQKLAQAAENIHSATLVNQQVTCELQRANQTVKKQIEELSQVSSDLIELVKGVKIENLTADSFDPWSADKKIIDVRRPDEWQDPQLPAIPNSILITLNDQFETSLSKLDPNAAYVFLCKSGGRSARATRIAQRLGFKKIYNLQGGTLALAEKNKVYQNIIKEKSGLASPSSVVPHKAA